jgi:hypothetical protein
VSKMFTMAHEDGRTCLVAHGDKAAEAAMAAKGFAREDARIAEAVVGDPVVGDPVADGGSAGPWTEDDRAQLEAMTVPQLRDALSRMGSKAPAVADKAQLREMLKTAVLAKRLEAAGAPS